MADLAEQRERMVRNQIIRRGVSDPRLLEAMRHVPRERFIPESFMEFAYEDGPLPIEAGQTISQPYIVARMTEAAEIAPGDHVLEVGTGSGYAAAVISLLAAHVYTIERHQDLATIARRRLADLGYANVDVRVGDGTQGWPEAAPFDAIIVAAGGPEVPDMLCRQLRIGGHLIIPVGSQEDQRLLKLTRTGQDEFDKDDLGGVTFVPLIGEHGWKPRPGVSRPAPTPVTQTVPEMIAQTAEPLPDIQDPAFGRLFDRFAAAHVVLLGEASHGTSEFYRARCAITRRLIEQHGFTIVAVEADWPDAATVNRFVRGHAQPEEAEPPFERFPTWMWRNTDVDTFIRWLRDNNRTRAADQQAGFYGLDLYNLSGSIRAVIDYLDRVDPSAAAIARERYGCLMPWGASPQSYGRMALNSDFTRCEQAVVEMLRELNERRLQYAARDGDQFLDAQANALLVKNAELYYRAMYHGSAESWNIRDQHMFDTLCHLLQAGGAGAKAVVWAHNSHIGDARFTDMGEVREELNIGQLCRERFAADAAMIGFGTHTGTVAAADNWDEPMKIKRVNPSRPDSYERLAHDSGAGRFLLDLRQGAHDPLREKLIEPRLERFIGVIYRPDTERWSHYSHCTLPRQFDAWVWFDETHAVTPLPGPEHAGADETYPFGL